MRKYSCSGPTVVKTRLASTPSSRSARTALRDSASIERSSGILWSSASPVHDAKAVGMHSSAPLGFSKMKAGEVGSDRKSTRLNSSHLVISYAVFCLKKKIPQYNIHLRLDGFSVSATYAAAAL